MSEYAWEAKAPEFPPGLDWLNVERPLQMRELRGKVVLLGVYTSCCVHCMHVIHDLKRLVTKYPSELVVVGVHSPKYTGEQGTETIRGAILRYGIEYPVINDRERQLWQAYQARTWPTLLLVSPEGEIVGRMSGEDVFEVLDEAILQLVNEFDARRMVNRVRLEFRPEQMPATSSSLAFPGKVLADARSQRLFVADTNHNRLVVASLADGAVTAIIGRGPAGLVDGNFEMAQFHRPQGLALDEEMLYVADTGNHALRRVDLARHTITTLAAGLSSPWDVAFHGGYLYLAMAGRHQLWRMDLGAGAVKPYAGMGREARVDGPLGDAAFAQPSGLVTDGRRLYVADSESNSIRSADLNEDGLVETIVGGDLFAFGDRDGQGLEVRFQHPLDVTYHDGFLYIADAYNHKIRRVSLATATAETFAGTGAAGHRDGDQPQFREPSGVCIAGNTLYVADTGNHAIRKVDLTTRRAETMQLAAGLALGG